MKVFGQDLLVLHNQVTALYMNVKAWWLFTFVPHKWRPKMILPPKGSNACVSISGPGGLDQLQVTDLGEDRVTVGCNIKNLGYTPPYVTIDRSRPLVEQLHPSLVLVEVDYFSVNYADVCIRWGLYESALRFVGWPIVPGFDLSGKVVWAGKGVEEDAGADAVCVCPFNVGDSIFGFSLFGSYSRFVLVPARQLRNAPRKNFIPGSPKYSQAELAGVPAAAATALHALALARAWPQPLRTRNKAALIHSAAGGVGSQLIQMCKICGLWPIVAVVGSSHKVDFCTALGADVVIDKSTQDLWAEAEKASPDGYACVFDANGLETLQASFDHVARCGALVVYGFHSNLPKASTLLSPLSWLGLIFGMAQMPKFDPMLMTLESKTVAGFNLSFFEEEHDLIKQYLGQVVDWLEQGKIKPSEVTEFPIADIGKAHALIQSGQSKGKIVVSPVVLHAACASGEGEGECNEV